LGSNTGRSSKHIPLFRPRRVGVVLLDCRCSPKGTSIVALFLSYTQRPSRAREDTLPNGISWVPQLLTTALRTELGTMLVIGVVKHTTATTAYFRSALLDKRVQPAQHQAKFLSALPWPMAGPSASKELLCSGVVPSVTHRLLDLQ